jgi:hypothetical protein
MTYDLGFGIWDLGFGILDFGTDGKIIFDTRSSIVINSPRLWRVPMNKLASVLVQVKNLAVASCILLIVSASVIGQASVRDLNPSHAAAVETYLSENKQKRFRADVVDDDYLKSMRESFGKNFIPDYVAADFNGDRINDFAVLLQREGEPTNQAPGENASKEHFPDYPLTLVVFNGIKGGKFRVAFTQNVDGPRAAFINVTTGRRKSLYYGIFETDSDTFTLAPAGRGYVVKR